MNKLILTLFAICAIIFFVGCENGNLYINKNSEFIDLLFLGYLKINDEMFNHYLEIVGKDKCDVSLENVFSVNNKKR